MDLGAGAITTTLFFGNAASGYTIGAGEAGSQTLTRVPGNFSSGVGITIASSVPVEHTINANLVLGNLQSSSASFSFGSLSEDSLLKVAGNVSGFRATGLSLAGSSNGIARYEIGGIISGAMNLAVQLNSKTLLLGANTYTGTTLVDANSTLTLGISGAIPDSSNMRLGPSKFATGGFSETLGSLELTNGGTIDFGVGSSALAFADSSALSWTGALLLANFDIGFDTLKFGSTSGGLTSAQLDQISLPGYKAELGGDGIVSFVAIPEPSTVCSAPLLDYLGWRLSFVVSGPDPFGVARPRLFFYTDFFGNR